MAQYVCGHFPGAFNLDASLMLEHTEALKIVEKPGEFGMAVQSLGAFKAKTHPLDHLCFMGSGREEEDQYLHMLLASFLHKGLQHVSLAKGGYSALHDVLRESLSSRLSSHSVKGCMACNPGTPRGSGRLSSYLTPPATPGASMLWKGLTALKSKGGELKDRVVDYAVNAQNNVEEKPTKHVTAKEREKGRRYRGVPSAFSINSEDDESDDEFSSPRESSKPQHREKVKLKDWLAKQPDITATFDCRQVDDKSMTHQGHVAITRTHLFILRDVDGEKGTAYVMARRPLANIVKITSKKRLPELLTLRHGYEMTPGKNQLTGSDCLLVPKAGDCAKAVKSAIIALQGIDLSQPPPRSSPSSASSPSPTTPS